MKTIYVTILAALLALVAAVAFATAGKCHADDMPFAVVAAGEGFTNRLSRAAAGWTDGTVTVAIGGDGRSAGCVPKSNLKKHLAHGDGDGLGAI